MLEDRKYEIWLREVGADFDRLKPSGRGAAQGRPPATPGPRVKPGTELLREWLGTLHEVIVPERGMVYRGKS